MNIDWSAMVTSAGLVGSVWIWMKVWMDLFVPRPLKHSRSCKCWECWQDQ